MVEHTRTLDFKIAFALGLGTMIAAGIFSLSGSAVLRIGSTAVVAFTLAAVVAGLTAAAYSEFASIYSENGGGYLFTSRTFEGLDFLKYGIGMALFLGYTGTTAFYLATMDEWFFRFIVPGLSGTVPHGTFGVLTAVLLGVLNARGTEESGAFQLVVTSAKVAILVVFVGGMFAAVGFGPATTEFATSFQFEPVETVSVAALAFITFFGFSAIAASAGEIIEPRKTVPRAIAASIVTVTVLYAFVIVAMVNIYNVTDRLARDPQTILELGETAMGAVSQAFIPVTVSVLGNSIAVGEALIVAGAIFSMVSASNASILAASGIGSLMGRQGHAPRRFSRIHPEYGTPFWSVTTVTLTIAGLIVVFITLLSEEGVTGLHVLGLNSLTGFATFNLLVPLAVVNVALIYSRRNFPDLERGFRMPGVPVLPILGVVANLALILNLPTSGVVVGIAVVLALSGLYFLWGGGPDIEDLYERAVEPRGRPGGETPAGAASEPGGLPEDAYRVLVPVARPSRAERYVRLAALIGRARSESPAIQVVNVTEIPEQTPNELVRETAEGRADRISETLAAADVDVEYTVEGHISRDVGFDIVHTARGDEADLILMGYPTEHPEIAEAVEYDSPCDVVYASGFPDDPERLFETVTVGVGGGPHHRALLPLVNAFGAEGRRIRLVSVDPADGPRDKAEDPEATLSELEHREAVDVRHVSSASVAEGLVSSAAESGGVLLIGASRDRRLKRWVFGSTPDRVVKLAAGSDPELPVLVYASAASVPQRIEATLFPVYKYFKRFGRTSDTTRTERTNGPDATRTEKRTEP
ncbi:amino acid permease [Halopelagius longus]|uniref:Amino acid permease n=1 Tax=Halopelagius longus TaxID=1236180 RepID=A0A1H1BIQ5_9EURY|nr:amino acid permease [Halopelagius longus]RDI70800.1 amino acid permease [Halopelagius longus]SDQ51781.1 Amino acid transporter [Halopelagius longus]